MVYPPNTPPIYGHKSSNQLLKSYVQKLSNSDSCLWDYQSQKCFHKKKNLKIWKIEKKKKKKKS